MSSRRSVAPELIAAARVCFEAGGTLAECAAICGGVARSTVSAWSKADGWVHGPTDTQAQTAAAGARNVERWSQRRAREADEAGAIAASVREAGRKAIDDDNPQMVRACGIFYGILIDKAQLLSGGATGRVDSATPEQRRERIRQYRDELADRRKVA